jgi:hypothetical protein
MFSKRTLVRTLVTLAAAGLFVLSLRGPDRDSSDLSMLMEPDGTGIWRDLILQRWLSSALTGRSDPEEALKNAANETRSLLGSGL